MPVPQKSSRNNFAVLPRSSEKFHRQSRSLLQHIEQIAGIKHACLPDQPFLIFLFVPLDFLLTKQDADHNIVIHLQYTNSMDAINLKNPELYNNRELSLLEFNRRVLAMAEDPEVPLLERLQFMTITSTNLDEFFEIRIAGLKQQVAFASVQTGPDNLSPVDQLKRVSDSAHQLIEDQYKILNEQLIPDLGTPESNFFVVLTGMKKQQRGFDVILPRKRYPF